MADNYIKGEGLVLYLYDTTAWKPIACLTSNSLSRARNIIEAETKCSPGEVIKAGGTTTYELPFEAIYINTTDAAGSDLTKASHDALMDIFDANVSQQWKLDNGLTDSPAYFGTGLLNTLDLTAPAGSVFATFSGNISGTGAITKVDPTV